MAIKIQLGPGNSIEKNISHTNEIQDSWIEFLGALGLALKDTATVKTIEILLRGTWVPGNWA